MTTGRLKEPVCGTFDCTLTILVMVLSKSRTLLHGAIILYTPLCALHNLGPDPRSMQRLKRRGKKLSPSYHPLDGIALSL